MYDESSCFDPNAMMAQTQLVSESEAVMSATATQTHNNTFAYSYSSGEDAAANSIANCSSLTNRLVAATADTVMEIIDNSFNTQFAEVVNHGSCQDLYSFPHPSMLERGQQQYQYQDQQFPYPTPDLLNLLHSPSRPMGTADSTNVSSVSYDPFLHLNLQQPPPMVANDFTFVGDFGNGVAEFTQDVGRKRGGKRIKQFTSATTTTERQRRVDMSSKFDALKELIPNPSKSDRASVVGDAINYIRELKRTVEELKLLVEKKRHEKQRVRHKVEIEADAEGEDPDYSESLRSCWIQRKSKDTEVDVRIVDNEVTIKLVQRKKNDCLVHVSHVLDQLNLDLQHVAGGHIGDFCSYLFNTKICEGSSVYASAIANKLIQVMDTSLASASLT